MFKLYLVWLVKYKLVMMEISIFYLYIHYLYCFFIEDYVNNIEQSRTLETSILILKLIIIIGFYI